MSSENGHPIIIENGHLNLRGLGLETHQLVECLQRVSLSGKSVFTSLDVAQNKLDASGAKIIAQYTQLTSLDIFNNQIGALGACSLAKNTSLVFLNAALNQIGDEGCKAFAANKSLGFLLIFNNEITDKGACALATNSTLLKLSLYNNLIGDRGARALLRNTTLTSLDISENQIKAKPNAWLCFQNNTTLTALNVAANWFDQSDMEQHLVETILRRNSVAQCQRRDRFCQSMFVLLLRAPQQSYWMWLPLEVRRYIVFTWICSNRQFSASVGKTPQQMVRMLEFLFANTSEFNQRLRTGEGVRILECSTNGHDYRLQFIK